MAATNRALRLSQDNDLGRGRLEKDAHPAQWKTAGVSAKISVPPLGTLPSGEAHAETAVNGRDGHAIALQVR